jgi:hypothetical protein
VGSLVSRFLEKKLLYSFVFMAVLVATLWGYLSRPVRGCEPVGLADENGSIEINKPGTYCLASNVIWEKSGPALRINSSKVTLDLNGKSVRGAGDSSGQIGVLIDGGLNEVAVKNGKIDSFRIGIKAQDTESISIDGIEFSSVSWIAVHLTGKNHRLENSSIRDIGEVDYSVLTEKYVIGLLATVDGMRVTGNSFFNVAPPKIGEKIVGEGVSIIAGEGSRSWEVASNVFENITINNVGTIGLWGRGIDFSIFSNKFFNIQRPIEGAYQGLTQISRNRFEIKDDVLDSGTKLPRIVDGKVTARNIAISMNFDPLSRLSLDGNEFDGYACPVSLADRVNRSGVSIHENTIKFRGDDFYCWQEGVWLSKGVFAPLRDYIN